MLCFQGNRFSFRPKKLKISKNPLMSVKENPINLIYPPRIEISSLIRIMMRRPANKTTPLMMI